MARKSINELVAQAIADFPDNVTGLITPAALRQFCLDFLAAITPAYGVLQRTSPNTQTVGTTDALVVFSGAQDSDPAQTTTAVPASTITRAERGTSEININLDIECATNREVTLTLYKNGVATPFRITTSGRGSGSPVGVGMVAFDYADPAAVYDLRAKTDAAGTSVIFSNGLMLLSVVPVRSFT